MFVLVIFYLRLDETFETFLFASTEVLKHIVCEMDARKRVMDTSTKHQASLWCAAVVLSHCYNIRALLDTSTVLFFLMHSFALCIVATYHTLVSNTAQH